jgi:hypothetical protein
VRRDICRAYFVCVGDFAINIAATLSAKIGIGNRTLKFISLSSNIVQIANCKHFTIAIYSDSAVLRVISTSAHSSSRGNSCRSQPPSFQVELPSALPPWSESVKNIRPSTPWNPSFAVVVKCMPSRTVHPKLDFKKRQFKKPLVGRS